MMREVSIWERASQHLLYVLSSFLQCIIPEHKRKRRRRVGEEKGAFFADVRLKKDVHSSSSSSSFWLISFPSLPFTVSAAAAAAASSSRPALMAFSPPPRPDPLSGLAMEPR